MILKRMPDGVDYFSAVVIFCFNKRGELVLLKKRKDHPIYPGLLGFPAGKVREGENFKKASKREVLEETGNETSEYNLSFFSLDPTIHFKPNGEPFYFFCHAYYLNHGCCLSEITINPKEHEEFITVRPEKILKMDKNIFIPDAWDNFRDFYLKNHNKLIRAV